MICGNEQQAMQLGWVRPSWRLPDPGQTVLILARESKHRIEEGKVYICRAIYQPCYVDHKIEGQVLEFFEYCKPNKKQTNCHVFTCLKYQEVPAWSLHENLVHWWNSDLNADMPELPMVM